MLQSIPNPNQRTTIIFLVLTAVCGLLGIGGLLGGEDGFVWGLLGLILAGCFAFIAPWLWFSGKQQVGEIQALLAGEGLLAQWASDPDEWQRYTENEYMRGVKQTKTVVLWTFLGLLVVMLLGAVIAGIFEPFVIVLEVVLAAVMAGLLGGINHLMTRSAYAQNLKGGGAIYIGTTSAYFNGRFYTWKSKWATLEKVAFEPGDPSVVEIAYRYGSGDGASHVEVRIPVPRGREAEAEHVVSLFYAAD